MKLSKRLAAIAELIRPGAEVCDVGTDHAFLPCCLAKSGRYGAVRAGDLNPNPLKIAAAEIAGQGADVTLVQSDGLAQFPPPDSPENTDVVIAGMGGELIARIVENAPPYFGESRYILQPMTRAKIMEERLNAAGYFAESRTAVTDGRRTFQIVIVRRNTMSVTVRDIYDYTDEIAPFSGQEQGDNCGLLVGELSAQIRKVLVCLDATNAVIAEAVEKGANLIIAHHPLMYFGVKRIPAQDPVHNLIRNNINMIAAHTNLDVADGGVTDEMLVRLGLPTDGDVIDFFGKTAELPAPLTAEQLAEKCKTAFGCSVVRYVDGGKPITRIGLCSGGGSMLVEKAAELGCGAYICGDLRWDRMVYAANTGLTLIDAGHFHTEDIICDALVRKIKGKFPEISIEKAQNSVDVCKYV